MDVFVVSPPMFYRSENFQTYFALFWINLSLTHTFMNFQIMFSCEAFITFGTFEFLLITYGTKRVFLDSNRVFLDSNRVFLASNRVFLDSNRVFLDSNRVIIRCY